MNSLKQSAKTVSTILPVHWLGQDFFTALSNLNVEKECQPPLQLTYQERNGGLHCLFFFYSFIHLIGLTHSTEYVALREGMEIV